MAAKHVIYFGRVQGVGFRYTAHRIACRYELAGYVRNQSDGSVEMWVQGEGDDVQDCLSDIAESFGANIRETKTQDVEPDPSCQHFGIKM